MPAAGRNTGQRGRTGGHVNMEVHMTTHLTGWEAHVQGEQRLRARPLGRRRVALMASVLAVVLVCATLVIGGCAGPVRDMTVCRADWEQVQPGQVLCTADGRVEIVGRCFDPETGRFWLKVRSRW